MAGLRYLFDYCGHFWKANSRHGTHSPFVYRLADELIYKRRARKPCTDTKSNLLLCEIADYLDVEYTLSKDDADRSKALIVPHACVTVGELSEWQYHFCYIVLRDIYRGKENKKRWQRICEDSRFVVTIDLFFFGLIFYRREQTKQNFRLRFPFWKY